MWKFAGLKPEIRWFEYDFDKVFESGRENFGEVEAKEAQGLEMMEKEQEKETGGLTMMKERGSLYSVYDGGSGRDLSPQPVVSSCSLASHAS